MITETEAMVSGLERAWALAEVHGVDSPQVLDCLSRWGSIIDDVRGAAASV